MGKANLISFLLFFSSVAQLYSQELSQTDFKKDLVQYVKTNRQLRGTSKFDRDLSATDFSSAGLVSAELAYADFSKTNFFGANLSKANLSNTNLSGADFSQADLTGADLTNANLSGADLRGAILTDAIFTGANLQGANFTKTIITQKVTKEWLKEKGALNTDETKGINIK